MMSQTKQDFTSSRPNTSTDVFFTQKHTVRKRYKYNNVDCKISFSRAGKRTLGVKKILVILMLTWSLHVIIPPPVIPNSRVTLPSSTHMFHIVKHRLYVGGGRFIFIPMLAQFFFQKSLLQSDRRYSPKRIG